jgi:hypothetical protein
VLYCADQYLQSAVPSVLSVVLPFLSEVQPLVWQTRVRILKNFRNNMARMSQYHDNYINGKENPQVVVMIFFLLNCDNIVNGTLYI